MSPAWQMASRFSPKSKPRGPICRCIGPTVCRHCMAGLCISSFSGQRQEHAPGSEGDRSGHIAIVFLLLTSFMVARDCSSAPFPGALPPCCIIGRGIVARRWRAMRRRIRPRSRLVREQTALHSGEVDRGSMCRACFEGATGPTLLTPQSCLWPRPCASGPSDSEV